jgi:hypothetical protein
MRQSSYHFYIRNARKYGKIFKVRPFGARGSAMYRFPGEDVFGSHASIPGALQVWYGATPVIVVTDADLGRAINLRNPNRHTAMGPAAIMAPKDRMFDSDGILLTKECAPTQSVLPSTHIDGHVCCGAPSISMYH